MSFITGVPGVRSNLPDYNLDMIHPLVQQKILALASHAASMDYMIQINSGYRDFMQQANLYNQASQLKYGAAAPSKSRHVGGEVNYAFGLAIDINIIDFAGNKIDSGHQLYRYYGQYWETLGPISINGKTFNPNWGGRFGDPIHFDYRAVPLQPPMSPSTAPSPGMSASTEKPSNNQSLKDAAMKEALTKPCNA